MGRRITLTLRSVDRDDDSPVTVNGVALSQNLHIQNAILEIRYGLLGSRNLNGAEGVMSDKQKKKIKSLKKEVKDLKSQLKKFKLTSAVKKNAKLKAAISSSKPPAAPTLVTKPDKSAETAAHR